jgi:hypothetical protein
MYEVRGATGFKDVFERGPCAAIADVVMWRCWLFAVAIIYASSAGQGLREKKGRKSFRPFLIGRS